MQHLIYAGRPAAEQREAFLRIIGNDPVVSRILEAVAGLDLPDWWLVSGALYNTVWNALTGRPPGYGIRDADLFYFDDTDLSYAAENRVIAAATPFTRHLPVPVEIRNQARVHLWFEDKFGVPYPPLRSGCEGIARFTSRAHAVGVRLQKDGSLRLHAPFGLEDIFAFRVAPNTVLDNRRTHMAKAERAKSCWPELEIVPWPESQVMDG